MQIRSFIQPDENSCVGYLLSIENFVPYYDGDNTIINWACSRSLAGTSCCNKIAIIALRILFTIAVIVAAAVDLVIWTLKTITVIPAIRRGCPEHLADFTSALFCSVTAIAIIFGYPPTLRRKAKFFFRWEYERAFYRESPHEAILSMYIRTIGGYVNFSVLSIHIDNVQKREWWFENLKSRLELGAYAEANEFFEFEKFHENMKTFVEKINKLHTEFGRFNQEQARFIPPLQHTETQKMITELEEITRTCRYSSQILNCLKSSLSRHPEKWQPFSMILTTLEAYEQYAEFLVDRKQELIDARQKFRDKTVSFLPINDGSKNLILAFL